MMYFFKLPFIYLFYLLDGMVILFYEISKEEDNTHMLAIGAIYEDISLLFCITYKIRYYREIGKICLIILFFNS